MAGERMGIAINAVVLVGNLTKDPEIRHTAGESPVVVAGLRIAVNGSERVGGQWRDRADYFDVRVFGNQAESCGSHLKRGSKVCVDGRLRHEEWQPTDGPKRSRVLIVARNVQFLDRRGDGGGHESAAWIPDGDFKVPEGEFSTGDAGADFPSAGVDDDIPF